MKNKNTMTQADALEDKARECELGAAVLGMGADGPCVPRLKQALELRAQAARLRDPKLASADSAAL